MRDFHPDRAPAKRSGAGTSAAGPAHDGADEAGDDDDQDEKEMVWHLLSLEISQHLGQKRTEARGGHAALQQ